MRPFLSFLSQRSLDFRFLSRIISCFLSYLSCTVECLGRIRGDWLRRRERWTQNRAGPADRRTPCNTGSHSGLSSRKSRLHHPETRKVHNQPISLKWFLFTTSEVCDTKWAKTISIAPNVPYYGFLMSCSLICGLGQAWMITERFVIGVVLIRLSSSQQNIATSLDTSLQCVFDIHYTHSK